MTAPDADPHRHVRTRAQIEAHRARVATPGRRHGRHAALVELRGWPGLTLVGFDEGAAGRILLRGAWSGGAWRGLHALWDQLDDGGPEDAATACRRALDEGRAVPFDPEPDEPWRIIERYGMDDLVPWLLAFSTMTAAGAVWLWWP